ncbi:uncharacterized protein F4822DRAFT_428443 [Hypoxylon trugodes]|uniref:uncharacterized protein n=1 Tax=Hypoxylon trugodes TaxID=326681 RepID=UPI002199BD61|nr:uncharacterized protein F4822DRAFT_428443 [Hypoxylon trugodes]KAI1390100.1 hypothetical protein F4822DRAFT_428443 [Hypoxylon trugodes]
MDLFSLILVFWNFHILILQTCASLTRFPAPHAPMLAPQEPLQETQEQPEQPEQQEKKGGPNADCPLLQLPVELMFIIAEQLPPSDRPVFSQACRALRGTLGDGLAAHLSGEEYCEYLALVARGKPNHWVCEACLRLHPITELDTPHDPWRLSCPLGWDDWRQNAYGQNWYPLSRRLFRADHRHIQLTLKYVRLNIRSHMGYLARLLKPIHYNTSRECTRLGVRPYTLSRTYTATPKIVLGDDGISRYLLQSKWHFPDSFPRMCAETVGDLTICSHCNLRFHTRGFPVSGVATLEMVLDFPMWLHGGRDMPRIFHCIHCRTDFRVTKSFNDITIFAWRDFGPECSPLNTIWRAHVSNPGQRPVGWHVEHMPGSIEILYKSRGCEGRKLLG